jgi:hypothetical protein
MENLPSIVDIAMTVAGLVFGLPMIAMALCCIAVLIIAPFLRVK